jgi:hypothetical protein
MNNMLKFEDVKYHCMPSQDNDKTVSHCQFSVKVTKVNRRFGGTYRLQVAWHLLARWFAEPMSSTLKMEATCSSETSAETQRTTRRHIPEDDTLQDMSMLK